MIRSIDSSAPRERMNSSESAQCISPWAALK